LRESQVGESAKGHQWQGGSDCECTCPVPPPRLADEQQLQGDQGGVDGSGDAEGDDGRNQGSMRSRP